MYAREVLIETKRLRLRPLEISGLDEFAALHSDPEVTEFIARSTQQRPVVVYGLDRAD